MKQTLREYRTLLRTASPLLVTLMVLSVVGMNLLANKSIDTGLSWLALDGGILFSWLAFLSMDVLTHCYGPRAANMVSVTALLLNLFMALIFFLGSRIPGLNSKKAGIVGGLVLIGIGLKLLIQGVFLK